jgi:hypothetical protein
MSPILGVCGVVYCLIDDLRRPAARASGMMAYMYLLNAAIYLFIYLSYGMEPAGYGLMKKENKLKTKNQK